jgi:uncharacterized protein (DUF305 family)
MGMATEALPEYRLRQQRGWSGPDGKRMGMGGGTNLSALAAAPDFDRAFIEQMSQWYRSWYSTP